MYHKYTYAALPFQAFALFNLELGIISMPTPQHLLGTWSFLRCIQDRHRGQFLVYVGRGVFTSAPEPGVLVYKESSVLVGHHDPALNPTRHGYRSYIYRWVGEGLTITHPDGAILHVFEDAAASHSLTHTHICAQDTYRCRYRFALPHAFERHYLIEGPRKNMRLHTRFQRMHPHP